MSTPEQRWTIRFVAAEDGEANFVAEAHVSGPWLFPAGSLIEVVTAARLAEVEAERDALVRSAEELREANQLDYDRVFSHMQTAHARNDADAAEINALRLERDEARADLERAREALAEARNDLAELLRQHTRAIWTLAGEAEYPQNERSLSGMRGQAALVAIDAALAAPTSTEDRDGFGNQ
jgi:multidrug resistance efflux pump